MPPPQLQATIFNNNCTYLHVMSRCLLVVALHYTAAQHDIHNTIMACR